MYLVKNIVGEMLNFFQRLFEGRLLLGMQPGFFSAQEFVQKWSESMYLLDKNMIEPSDRPRSISGPKIGGSQIGDICKIRSDLDVLSKSSNWPPWR